MKFKKLNQPMRWPNLKRNRRIAIGDIHGQYDLLIQLMDKIKFNPEEDELIFLGDYIDRGKTALDEINTINYLIDLVNQYPNNIVLLRGNHEEMVLNACVKPKSDWSRFTTAEKITSFTRAGMDNLCRFCESLPLYYLTDDHLFVHAGAIEDMEIYYQPASTLLWTRTNINGYKDKTVVCGHTPAREIVFKDKFICIDTCAFKYGVLTGYDVVNEKVYEVGR